MRSARKPAIGRLKKRPEFLAAASGRRFHSGLMTVQARLRPDAAEFGLGGAGLRFGFTVTKRVGHATERNRIKRRLRSAALDAGAAHADIRADVVVIARRDVLVAAYDQLVADLAKALGVVTRPGSGRGLDAGGRRAPGSDRS